MNGLDGIGRIPTIVATIAAGAVGLAVGVALGSRTFSDEQTKRSTCHERRGGDSSESHANVSPGSDNIPPGRILLLVTGSIETQQIVEMMELEEEVENSQHVLNSSKKGYPFGHMYRGRGRIDLFSMGEFVGSEAVITSLVWILKQNIRKYELVIACGYCGVLSPASMDASIGDVVAAATSCYFERRISAFGPVSKRLGIEETSTWAYTSAVAHQMSGDMLDNLIPHRLIVGKVASGRSFSTDFTGLRWMTEMNCTAKDMETAATVTTCVKFGIPATSLRVITNVIDGSTEIETFRVQRQKCAPILAAATRSFCHRSLEQLDRITMHSLMTRVPSSSIIALHVAMVEEAEPVAAALGLMPRVIPPFSTHGLKCWLGCRDHSPILMVAHGRDDKLGMSRVSTEIATFATNILITTYGESLKCVINCGTAGAMCSPGNPLEIGSIVVAKQVKFFDDRGMEPRQLDLWSAAANAVVQKVGSSDDRIHEGLVGTGSSFDSSDTDLACLRALGADVKEMEAASVVWTCNRLGIPALVVKSVTDFVEHEAEGAHEFSQNLLGKARDSLTDVMPRIVDLVIKL